MCGDPLIYSCVQFLLQSVMRFFSVCFLCSTFKLLFVEIHPLIFQLSAPRRSKCSCCYSVIIFGFFLLTGGPLRKKHKKTAISHFFFKVATRNCIRQFVCWSVHSPTCYFGQLNSSTYHGQNYDTTDNLAWNKGSKGQTNHFAQIRECNSISPDKRHHNCGRLGRDSNAKTVCHLQM